LQGTDAASLEEAIHDILNIELQAADGSTRVSKHSCRQDADQSPADRSTDELQVAAASLDRSDFAAACRFDCELRSRRLESGNEALNSAAAVSIKIVAAMVPRFQTAAKPPQHRGRSRQAVRAITNLSAV